MKLRPSNSERWANCPGSFLAESLFPEIETEEAREGTAAHFYPSEYLEGREWPVGYVAPNGVPITAEMIEGGKLWIAEVQNALAARPHARAYVERRVYAHSIINPLCDGTPDTVIIDPIGRFIQVIDYKFGHRYVEVHRNLQTAIYLAAVVETLELTPVDLASWTVKITVIQPRFYTAAPVRHWDVNTATIWGLFNWISDQAAEALRPDSRCVTGSHCLDCKARHACQALHRAGSAAIEASGQNLPLTIDGRGISTLLSVYSDAAERLKSLIAGLEAHAEYEIRAGRVIPGYALEPSSNREYWTVPASEVIAAGDSVGLNLRKTVDAVTPKQARDAGLDRLAKEKLGLDGGVTPLYSRRKAGALRLVRTSEHSAEKAFGSVPSN